MKVVGDSGNLADEPSMAEGPGADGSMDPGPNYANGQWLNAEQPVQTLTPSSGMGHGGSGGSFGNRNGEGRDATGSPDEGHSTGLTPNSSSANGSNHLHPSSHMNRSGASSYNASPSIGSINAGSSSTGQNMTNGAFFGDMNNSGSFLMQTGIDQQQQQPNGGHFASMNGGWPEMQQDHGQQQDMPPGDVGDGVLRAFMNMGPMDTMDLPSTWTDSGAGEMR